MQIRFAEDIDRKSWNQFVLSSPYSSFMQTWEWGNMQEQFGMKIWRLIVEDDSAILATAFVLKRDLPFGQSWLYCPRGPIVSKASKVSEASEASNNAVIPDSDPGSRLLSISEAWNLLQKKFVELAEEENAIFVRIDPTILEKKELFFAKATQLRSRGATLGTAQGSFAFRKAEREVQPRHTLLLDLTKSEEDLLAAMHSKTRYNIRLAERKGITVRFSSDPKDVDIFLNLSKEVLDRSGFHYHPEKYYRVMIETLSSEFSLRLRFSGGSNLSDDKTMRHLHETASSSRQSEIPRSDVTAELAIAEHDGDPLAAHIMIYAGDTATYVHGASSSKKKNLMASHRLFWETIRRAKERGYKIYDFFGVAPEGADANHTWAGITRIKMGFGGTRVSYIGAHDLVLEPGMYSVFNTARRIQELIR